jgi:hypothetical protein
MNDPAEPSTEPRVEPRPKPNNLRTGLLLAALALFFFVLLFVKRLWLG